VFLLHEVAVPFFFQSRGGSLRLALHDFVQLAKRVYDCDNEAASDYGQGDMRHFLSPMLRCLQNVSHLFQPPHGSLCGGGGNQRNDKKS
jgi:hypothetical protein